MSIAVRDVWAYATAIEHTATESLTYNQVVWARSIGNIRIIGSFQVHNPIDPMLGVGQDSGDNGQMRAFKGVYSIKALQHDMVKKPKIGDVRIIGTEEKNILRPRLSFIWSMYMKLHLQRAVTRENGE